MKMEEKIAKGKKYIMNTYGRLPIVLEKGEDSWVYDMDGNKYLDFVAGIAVNSLGHNSDVVNKALKEQSDKLIHCSNLYWIEPQIDLAELLCNASGMDKAFFCNSGAEANEGAIKLARKWGNGRYEIISAIQSFHGRTMGALAATGQENIRNHLFRFLRDLNMLSLMILNLLKLKYLKKPVQLCSSLFKVKVESMSLLKTFLKV